MTKIAVATDENARNFTRFLSLVVRVPDRAAKIYLNMKFEKWGFLTLPVFVRNRCVQVLLSCVVIGAPALPVVAERGALAILLQGVAVYVLTRMFRGPFEQPRRAWWRMSERAATSAAVAALAALAAGSAIAYQIAWGPSLELTTRAVVYAALTASFGLSGIGLAKRRAPIAEKV